MIECILPGIKDTNEYIAALSMFKTGQPLTTDEATTLVGLYQKYGRDVDGPATARLCIALDLLPGRTEADRADLAGLELPEADLDALFLAKGIVSGQLELTAQEADRAVDAVTGGTLTRPVDIILARMVLDTIAGSRNFGGLREQTRTVAEFLGDLGAEELDKYNIIVKEAKVKCRQ